MRDVARCLPATCLLPTHSPRCRRGTSAWRRATSSCTPSSSRSSRRTRCEACSCNPNPTPAPTLPNPRVASNPAPSLMPTPAPATHATRHSTSSWPRSDSATPSPPSTTAHRSRTPPSSPPRTGFSSSGCTSTAHLSFVLTLTAAHTLTLTPTPPRCTGSAPRSKSTRRRWRPSATTTCTRYVGAHVSE